MIGIVILNYQTWEISLRCIKSVLETQNELDCKIYLVDNASTEPMPESLSRYMEQHKSEICFLSANANKGYAAGNNIGIKKALEDKCEIIVITNNDIVFREKSLRNFVKCFGAHPEIGIVGPKVVDADGNVQNSRCSMKTGMKEMLQIYTMAKLICKNKWEKYFCLDQNPEIGSYVYHVSGCCFAMTAKCAKDVTPLDEGTMLYFEEPIIGIRMEEMGYRTYYEPQSTVVHQHGATTDRVQPFMFQCICQSELYYCTRYLQAKAWQKWLLFHYRRLLYWIRSRKDKELKEYWILFKKNTKKTYKEMRS